MVIDCKGSENRDKHKEKSIFFLFFAQVHTGTDPVCTLSTTTLNEVTTS